MLRLAGEARLRRAEVAGVHYYDLGETADGWSLLIHGKGDKKRIVPVSDRSPPRSAAEPLAIRQARRHAVGYSPHQIPCGHLTAGQAGKLVAGVSPDGWTMHTLRHRFATRAYRGSRNLRAMQVLLVHESIVTTERYTAVDDTEIRAAMAAAAQEIKPICDDCD